MQTASPVLTPWHTTLVGLATTISISEIPIINIVRTLTDMIKVQIYARLKAIGRVASKDAEPRLTLLVCLIYPNEHINACTVIVSS